MTDNLEQLVHDVVIAMPERAVRDMLGDLVDPDDMPDSALAALTESEARALLAALTYDEDDPEGTRAHCDVLAAL